MRLFQLTAIAAVCVLLLSSCTTEREYGVDHERLVDAALQAISDEAYVKPAAIQRTDRDEKGGKLTILEAPYNIYSRVKVEVDSTDEHCKMPELQVKITTDKIAWTRHKEWEQRIHEIVLLKLRAKAHGEESKPTALPTTAPKIPEPEAKQQKLPEPPKK